MRERSITAPAAQFLRRYLAAVARQERSEVLAFGVVTDHLHLLVAFHPNTVLPRLVQRLKGGSAVMGVREGLVPRPLRWAKGYNIETVSPSQVERAREYVLEQARRHPDRAIKDDDAAWVARLQPQSVAEPRLQPRTTTGGDTRRSAAKAAARPTDCR